MSQMKSPSLLAWEDILPRLDLYDEIIDVRSPGEFAEDHIPGAINCPVLYDEQRAEVGTLFSQHDGSFAARTIGAVYVTQNLSAHVATSFRTKPREWRPLVYCWRGGDRSGVTAYIFAKIGWPVTQLRGGYKAYRRNVSGAFLELASHLNFQVICGLTGSGKSRLLQMLAHLGAQVLDLERLASHKGSILGGLPGVPQPSQKAFESNIWDTLRKFDTTQTVYVECESKKIGNLAVPEKLMDRMRASQCTVLSLPILERVKLLMDEYPHFLDNPALLSDKLGPLISFFGRETINEWKTLAAAGEMGELFYRLLERHYDPAYSRSITRNFPQVGTAPTLEIGSYSTDAFLAAANHLVATS